MTCPENGYLVLLTDLFHPVDVRTLAGDHGSGAVLAKQELLWRRVSSVGL
jgi:hypothetical protein